MTIDKAALLESIKSMWPDAIDLSKDPTGPHDIYWALEKIVPADDHWRQLAMWSFHQALSELEKRAEPGRSLVVLPNEVEFADFDKWMRSNLCGDEGWAEERAIWESGDTL